MDVSEYTNRLSCEINEPKLLGTLNDIETLPNLASLTYNSRILFATDDFFSNAECMLQDSDPVWKDNEYTEYGKWMDGWETRRKRTVGHDWCLIELGLPGSVSFIEVDTRYFTGNQAPAVSVSGASLSKAQASVFAKDLPYRQAQIGTECSVNELEKAVTACHKIAWETLLGATRLKPGYPQESRHIFRVTARDPSQVFTHLRVNLFPDGGVARFRVFGLISRPDWQSLQTTVVNLASLENGGCALCCSDQHYGCPGNLIKRGRSSDMSDGWETARNPNRPLVYVKSQPSGCLSTPGSHWALLKLGNPGAVEQIEVDTNWFKGNFPESVQIDGFFSTQPDTAFTKETVPLLISAGQLQILPILSRTKLTAHNRHYFTGTDPERVPLEGADADYCLLNQQEKQDQQVKLHAPAKVSHVLVTMFPDGGISRVRIYGKPIVN